MVRPVGSATVRPEADTAPEKGVARLIKSNMQNIRLFKNPLSVIGYRLPVAPCPSVRIDGKWATGARFPGLGKNQLEINLFVGIGSGFCEDKNYTHAVALAILTCVIATHMIVGAAMADGCEEKPTYYFLYYFNLLKVNKPGCAKEWHGRCFY